MATYLNLEKGREERVVEESHELIPQRIDKFEVFFKAANPEDDHVYSNLDFNSLHMLTYSAREEVNEKNHHLILIVSVDITGIAMQLREMLDQYGSDHPLTIIVRHYAMDGYGTFDEEYDIDRIDGYIGPAYAYNLDSDETKEKYAEAELTLNIVRHRYAYNKESEKSRKNTCR